MTLFDEQNAVNVATCHCQVKPEECGRIIRSETVERDRETKRETCLVTLVKYQKCDISDVIMGLNRATQPTPCGAEADHFWGACTNYRIVNK